jgi:hypothetical protein
MFYALRAGGPLRQEGGHHQPVCAVLNSTRVLMAVQYRRGLTERQESIPAGSCRFPGASL